MTVPSGLLNLRRWAAGGIVLAGTFALLQLSQTVSPSSWMVWPLATPAGVDAAQTSGLGAWVVPSPLPVVWAASIALWVMVLVGSLLAAQDTPAAAQQRAFRKELRRQASGTGGELPRLYRLGRPNNRKASAAPQLTILRDVDDSVVEPQQRVA